MTVSEEIRAFIFEAFFVSDPGELTDEVSLIDSGIVDSTGMMDIILFLEERYGIHVEDQETVPDNLETIARIVSFVERKQSAAMA